MTACGFPNSKIGDETILCNLETGACFGLDAVGSRFPELLERGGAIAVAYRTMLGRVRRHARGSRSRSTPSPKRCDQEQIRSRELQTPSGTSAMTFLGR